MKKAGLHCVQNRLVTESQCRLYNTVLGGLILSGSGFVGCYLLCGSVFNGGIVKQKEFQFNKNKKNSHLSGFCPQKIKFLSI